jgi:hypothetical protein
MIHLDAKAPMTRMIPMATKVPDMVTMTMIHMDEKDLVMEKVVILIEAMMVALVVGRAVVFMMMVTMIPTIEKKAKTLAIEKEAVEDQEVEELETVMSPAMMMPIVVAAGPVMHVEVVLTKVEKALVTSTDLVVAKAAALTTMIPTHARVVVKTTPMGGVAAVMSMIPMDARGATLTEIDVVVALMGLKEAVAAV